MTSKCAKNKKIGTQGAAKCVTDVSTFWCPLWPVTAQSHTMENLFVFFISSFLIKKQNVVYGDVIICLSSNRS